MTAKLAEVAKAIVAGVVAAVTYLMGIIDASTPIGSMFSGLTAQQWGGLVLAVAGAYGVVWAVPNRQPGEHEA